MAGLLGDINPEDFLRETWGQCPRVLSPADSTYQALALTAPYAGDIIDWLAATVQPTSTRLVRSDGTSLSSRMIPAESTRQRTCEGLRTAYEDGYTIVANALSGVWAPLGRLCHTLQDELGHPVSANLYASPPHAQGFAPHNDGHDVFVLQLEGRKLWRLYGAPEPMPLEEDAGLVAPDTLGPPLAELVLDAGSALYIPCGHIHEAMTTTSASSHVTFGVHFVRWVDVLASELSRLARLNAAFRDAVPAGFAQSSGSAELVTQTVQSLLSQLADEASRPEVVGRMRARHAALLDAHLT
jgi:ribosomal protein L16 Arg81 hydroxylase